MYGNPPKAKQDYLNKPDSNRCRFFPEEVGTKSIGRNEKHDYGNRIAQQLLFKKRNV
jgi:hypothetical protein